MQAIRSCSSSQPQQPAQQLMGWSATQSLLCKHAFTAIRCTNPAAAPAPAAAAATHFSGVSH
jgi:hypothetical protein